jgi:5-methylcytosine-specific restriction endonuclease McrA
MFGSGKNTEIKKSKSTTKPKKSRYISKRDIKTVLLTQYNKCCNRPDKPAVNLRGYGCLLWKYQDGTFDESGYEMDHINEHCATSDNTLENLQALCPNCHSVKTRRFMKNKRTFTSTELDEGAALMEVDDPVNPSKKKKRKVCLTAG